MIVLKTWERLHCDKRAPGFEGKTYLDTYDGWFLFGLIPLFIRRRRERLQ